MLSCYIEGLPVVLLLQPHCKFVFGFGFFSVYLFNTIILRHTIHYSAAKRYKVKRCFKWCLRQNLSVQRTQYN